jgi:ABC-type transport system substrate-binding protein
MEARKKTIIIGIAIVLGITVLVFGIRLFSDKEGGTGLTKAAGDYYDWQLSQLPLAEQIRADLAERIQRPLHANAYVFQLATKVEVKDALADVCLREAVYWSDGKQLQASQVIDAFLRLSKVPSGLQTEDMKRWAQAIKIDPGDSSQCLKISGFQNRDDLDRLLASYYLSPIRAELIASEGADAWLVSLGAYKLEKILTNLPPNGSLTLNPNPRYYRGVKSEPKMIAFHQTAETIN